MPGANEPSAWAWRRHRSLFSDLKRPLFHIPSPSRNAPGVVPGCIDEYPRSLFTVLRSGTVVVALWSSQNIQVPNETICTPQQPPSAPSSMLLTAYHLPAHYHGPFICTSPRYLKVLLHHCQHVFFLPSFPAPPSSCLLDRPR